MRSILLLTWLALQGASPALSVAVVSRALAPGEAVRLDIAAGAPLASVAVTAFGARVDAFQVAPRRWRALVGIDLDVTPGAHPVVVSAKTTSGEAIEQAETFQVEARSYPTRQLTVAPRFVNPPKAERARIDRERKRLGAIFRAAGPEARWQGAFIRPVDSSVISGFGVRSVFNGEPRAPHGGADFRSPAGTPVVAPGGGRVVLASSLYFTGGTVVVDHGVRLVSLFAHLSRIDVKEGQEVARGDQLGLVGATGRVTGPHLHWTVRLGGARVDPISVIEILQEGP